MSFALHRLAQQKLPLASCWERMIDRVSNFVSPPQFSRVQSLSQRISAASPEEKNSIASSNRQDRQQLKPSDYPPKLYFALEMGPTVYQAL